jgi:hypothetical protein
MTETGMAILLVYGAKLFPPRDGDPGIEVMVDARGTVKLTAVGYPNHIAADHAITAAERTCLDADLEVSRLPDARSRLVRRKPCSSSAAS